MDQLQRNGSGWFRQTDTPCAETGWLSHGALKRVCVSKGPRALSLAAIGADIDGCLRVYAASSEVPM